MFLNYVLPDGTLWKAWVAAHWERRLKRQDYLSADIQGSVTFARERIQDIPLRCLGELLVGFCRLLLRRALLFDDKAEEVRLCLQTSREMPLPVVAAMPEAALTLKRPRGANWDLMPIGDISADGDLDMILEPVPLEDPDVLDELLEAGRRHTLPEECITLPPAAASPPRSSDSPSREGPDIDMGDLAFDAPTPHDRAELEALRQEAAIRASPLGVLPLVVATRSSPGPSPAGGSLSPSERPEIDRLLDASTGLDRFGFGSDALKTGPGVLTGPESPSGLAPSELALVPSGMLGSEQPGIDPLLDMRPDNLPPGSPLGLARQLRFDGFEALSSGGGDGGRSLFETIGFSPPGSTELDESTGSPLPIMPLNPLVEGVLEPTDIVECLGEELEPERPLDPEHPLVTEPAVEMPARKRRKKKIKPWFDEITTIPKDAYRDPSAFTHDLSQGHLIHLPYRRPGLPFTTVFSDICDVLTEPFAWAIEVGQRRRTARVAQWRAEADGTSGDAGVRDGAIEASPVASVQDALVVQSPQPGSAAPTPVGGIESPGMLPTGSPLPLTAVSPTAADPSSPAAPGTEQGTASPVPLSPYDPLSGGPGSSSPAALQDPYFSASPAGAADDAMGVSSPLPLPSPGTALPSPGTAVRSPGSPGALLPSPAAASHSGAGSPPAVAPSPMSADVASPAGLLNEIAVGQPLVWPVAPDGQDEVCSFYNLARAPPGGADMAARRFLNLLSMHKEGKVIMEQEQAYGDISVHRGPDWPGGLVVGDSGTAAFA